MMRFRERWLAKINIAVTNRITSLFAGWLPGFGILTHIGRESGKVYQTPVNVFQTHLQQRLRVVEERARSRRGCELNPAQRSIGCRSEGRARSYTATIPDCGAACSDTRRCG
jgi:hypothetical protein